MEFKLHGVPLSPFYRKVRILQLEKQLTFELLTASPLALPEGFKQLNPSLRIPVLEVDGRPLADSSVICQFLEQYCPHPALMPDDPWDAARCRWLEKFADVDLAAQMTFIIFRQRVVYQLSKRAAQEQEICLAMERIPPMLNYLEEQLGEQLYFVNNHFSMADIAIVCQLINWHHAGECLNSRQWPRLSAWYQRMLDRDSICQLVASEYRILKKLGLLITG